jgi:flagellar basal body-associated protein FliL
MAPTPARRKRPLIGYVLTALVVAHVAALVIFLIWFSAHPHPRQGRAGPQPAARPPSTSTASRASQ